MMWWRNEPFTLGGSGHAHLKVQGLSAGYGPFMVLRDIKLEARPGLTVILMAPTLIAGIDGMNFEEMPELGTRYGYYVVLGLIVVVCIALHRVFKRSGWL